MRIGISIETRNMLFFSVCVSIKLANLYRIKANYFSNAFLSLEFILYGFLWDIRCIERARELGGEQMTVALR